MSNVELTKTWQPIRGNYILRGDGFFVSYNPDTGADYMSGVLTSLGQMLGEDLEDGEETALVKKGDRNTYYILTGDFRAAYEQLIEQGFGACLAYFEKMEPEFGNNWSTKER